MGAIAAWIVLGLIAGAVARLVLPGGDRGGWFATLILGIAGALLGGWIARRFGYLEPPDPGEWIPPLKSIISASVGALVVLATWKWFKP